MRLLGGLGRGVAFLAVLAVFGFAFWLSSGDNFQSVRARLLPPAAPIEPAPQPVQAAAEVESPGIVLAGPGGRLSVADGGTGTLKLGHDGHTLRITAEAQGRSISLHTAGGIRYATPAGESVNIACEVDRLERVTVNGVPSMRQVRCPRSIAVTITREPSGSSGGAP